MADLVFPVLGHGLLVDVVVGLDRATTLGQIAAGQSITAPLRARGEIDTATNITAVSASLLQRLGVPPKRQTTTLTAAGSLPVNIFAVSLGIQDFRDPASPSLVKTLLVMELTAGLPVIDVLIGLDILLGCKFLLDGPAGEFSLEF